MRVLMLGIVVVVAALFPNSVQADDQQIADFVKARLQTEQQRGNLRGFNVDMRVDKGTIWFKGFVANRDQELLILRTAQTAGHLGVVQVVDDIELTSGATPQAAMPAAPYQSPQMQSPQMQSPQMQNLQMQQNVSQQHSMFMQAAANDSRAASQVAYQEPLLRANPLAQQPPAPTRSPLQPQQRALPQSSSWQPSSYAPPAPSQGLLTQSRMPIASQGGVPIQSNRPLAFASAGTSCTGQDCYDGYGLGSPIVSNGYSAGGPPPAPIAGGGFGGGGGGAGFESPNLPGYAWPGYAASPNYAAVTYPKQYSPSAWPYIGPFYPYPQVPLGWRKVSLEWDDGWWFVDFHDKSQ